MNYIYIVQVIHDVLVNDGVCMCLCASIACED